MDKPDWPALAKHHAPLFPWSEVKAAWEKMDAHVGSIAEEQAQREFGPLARACLSCDRAWERLLWISLGTSDEAWTAGDQRCGWITICVDCGEQVSFLMDEISVQLRREGNW